jgi:hypothetical protein
MVAQRAEQKKHHSDLVNDNNKTGNQNDSGHFNITYHITLLKKVKTAYVKIQPSENLASIAVTA